MISDKNESSATEFKSEPTPARPFSFYQPERDDNSDDVDIDEDADHDADYEDVEGSRSPLRTQFEQPGRPATSARQMRIFQKRQQGFQLARDDRAQGETRWVDENLEVLVRGEWMPATRHDWHRSALISQANQEGAYVHEPSRGGTNDDVTAYHELDRELDLFVRENRPAILYQWRPEIRSGKMSHPGWMEINGRIVIDRDNRPVRDWPELPLTISGQVEGLRMEYWRRVNRHITVADLRARMPQYTSKRLELTMKELVTSSFGNRMDRGRTRAACVAWNRREGTQVKEDRMLQLMPKDIRRTVRATNSTACWRDLEEHEVQWILEGNKGRGAALKRASWRALSPKTKAKRAEAEKARKERHNQEVVLGSDDTEAEYEEPGDVEPLPPAPPPAMSPTGHSNRSTDQYSDTSVIWRGISNPRANKRAYSSDSEDSDYFISGSQAKRQRTQGTLQETSQQTPQLIPDDPEEEQGSEQHAELDYDQNIEDQSKENVEDDQELHIENGHTVHAHTDPSANAKTHAQKQPDTTDHTQSRAPRPRILGIDYRFVSPKTPEEAISISGALEMTCLHFEWLTGHNAPPTDLFQSYLFQCYVLQVKLQEYYVSDDDVPELDIRDPWYGSIDGWRATDQRS